MSTELVEFLREQCVWEINGVRQLVYSSGLGNRVAILKETPIRSLSGSTTGMFQLKCVARHITDALYVFDADLGKTFSERRRIPEFLYSVDWLDQASEAFLKADTNYVQTRLHVAVEFTMGMDNVGLTAHTTMGTRLRWFTLPSINFHKLLIYSALRQTGAKNVNKQQAFGLSLKTIDGKRNNQISWRTK